MAKNLNQVNEPNSIACIEPNSTAYIEPNSIAGWCIVIIYLKNSEERGREKVEVHIINPFFKKKISLNK